MRLIHGQGAARQDGKRIRPPPGAGEFVVLADGDAERLDASLSGRAKKKHVDVLVALSPVPGSLAVVLGGVGVEKLPGDYPLVRATQHAGFPCRRWRCSVGTRKRGPGSRCSRPSGRSGGR